MADRGFTIEKELEALCVSLNIPSFLKGINSVKTKLRKTKQLLQWGFMLKGPLLVLKSFYSCEMK